MFPINFQNNIPNMNFNQMNNPMINNIPMQMNFNMNIQNQMFNQMYQNHEQINNGNDQYNDKIELMLGYNDENFQNYNTIMNCLTDPRKKLFISNTEQKKEILIPIYFTKNELYNYLRIYGSIVLIYNNIILDDDKTSIEDIPNNSTILIFRNPDFQDYSKSFLYKYILKLFPDEKRVNVICRMLTGNTYNFFFPRNISMSLLISFIKKILNLDNRYFFICNAKKIESNENSKLINFASKDLILSLTIYDSDALTSLSSFGGKEIKVTMFFKSKEVFKSKIVHKYYPISILYSGFDDGEISKIFVNGLLVSKDDHRSLASFGIDDDFGCIAE